jgi:hypothetical protein
VDQAVLENVEMHTSFQAKHVMMVIPNQEMDAQVLVLYSPPFTAQLASPSAPARTAWQTVINVQMLLPAKPVLPAIASMAHLVFFALLIVYPFVVIPFINQHNCAMMVIYLILMDVVQNAKFKKASHVPIIFTLNLFVIFRRFN